MTGKGHRFTGIGAAAIAAAIIHNIAPNPLSEAFAAFIAANTTTLPDMLEVRRYRGGRPAGTVIPHRTWTHWGLGWVLVILATILYLPSIHPFFVIVLIGSSVGSLMHLLGDAPNPMGVPWILPTWRMRVGRRGLWRSGENEASFGLFLNLVGVGVWILATDYVDSSYIVQAFHTHISPWFDKLLALTK